MEKTYLEHKKKIIEYIKEIDQSKINPSYLAITGLFKIYTTVTKRKKCFSCRGDRAFIYDYFKEMSNKWIIQ